MIFIKYADQAINQIKERYGLISNLLWATNRIRASKRSKNGSHDK